MLDLLALSQADARALLVPRAGVLPRALPVPEEIRMTALADWDPRKEPDALGALVQVAAALWHGQLARDARLADLEAGYPTGHRGGGGSAQDDTKPQRPPADPALRESREFDREIKAALEAAGRAWARHLRLVEPRSGVVKLTDPGCDLCGQVPGHWCPVYGVRVIMSPAARKGAKASMRTVRLCEWCFQMTWESRMGRLPNIDEVTAHSEGRRVNWRGGTEPRLVEVECPGCHDESRGARRECKTCGHSGKVLTVAAK